MVAIDEAVILAIDCITFGPEIPNESAGWNFRWLKILSVSSVFAPNCLYVCFFLSIFLCWACTL